MTGEAARDLAAVAELGERLRAELGLDAVLVKLSEEGMLVVSGGEVPRRIAAISSYPRSLAMTSGVVASYRGYTVAFGFAVREQDRSRRGDADLFAAI